MAEVLESDTHGKVTDTKRDAGEGNIVSLAENSYRRRCNEKLFTKSKPILTKDKRFLLTICDKYVIIISSRTGDIYKKFTKHKTNVTSIHLTEKDEEVLSADDGGTILFWNYRDCTIIKKVCLRCIKVFKVLYAAGSQDIYAIIRKKGQKGDGLPFLTRNSIEESDLSKGFLKPNIVCQLENQISNSRLYILSSKGDYFAYVLRDDEKTQFIDIWCLERKKRRRLRYPHVNEIVVMAFHPMNRGLAVADTFGRIMLWTLELHKDNFKGEEFRFPPGQELHWHSHPVEDMTFSNTGYNLWSVGSESVIVNWQLRTLHKDFISNMGSAIKYISISQDDSQIVVTLSNNKVKVISSASTNDVHCLEALSPECNVSMQRDPRTDSLVVPSSRSGVLQFYNPDTDTMLQEMDVTGENFISTSYKDLKAFDSVVNHIAFTHDGQWMVNAESSNFHPMPYEIRLKFWYYVAKEKRYELHTIVEPPHSAEILCMVASPKADFLFHKYLIATTSKDCSFKLWALNESTSVWHAVHKCQYSNQVCKKAAFSEDGSLLAVLFDEVITLWDPNTGQYRSSLVNPLKKEAFSQLCFCGGDSSQWLLATTDHYLLSWDLLSCTLSWSLEADIALLLADPFSKYAVIFATNDKTRTDLYFIDPTRPHPVATYMAIGINKHRVCSAVFLPQADQRDASSDKILDKTGRLYVLLKTKNTVIYTLEKVGNKVVREGSLPLEDLPDQTNFAKVFGMHYKARQETEKKMLDSISTVPTTARVVRKIMAAPSHVLPSVASLSVMLYKGALPISNSEKSGILSTEKLQIEENESDDDEEDTMEVDSDDEEMIPESPSESPSSKDQTKRIENNERTEEHSSFVMPLYETDWLEELFSTLQGPYG